MRRAQSFGTRLLVILVSILTLTGCTYGQPKTIPGPIFDYPQDGQTLDYPGAYMFRVHPVAGAQGYLWGFFQNGVLIWENWRDEGHLSSNEYSILPGTNAHTRFSVGDVQVWVRAWMGSEWSDATIITIHLR